METRITDNSLVLDVESCIPLRKATSKTISAGWGIMAEKHIQADLEIYRVEQPLMNVVSDEHMSDTCDNCLLWAGSALRKETNPTKELSVSSCKGCKVVRYCSKSCQVRAWKRHHKAECKIYDSRRSEGIPHFMRAIIRLLHLRLSGQLTENQWCALQSLESHRDKYKAAGGSLWAGVEMNCRDVKRWTGTDVEEEVLENMTCSIFVNSMSVESPEGSVIGSCLDSCAALMNHSCAPNAAFFFEGPELRVRSTGVIPAGEEITISYIDPTESFEFRQEQLRSKYFFECNCKKCEKGASGPGELRTGDSELDGRIKEAQSSLRALLRLNPESTSFEAVENAADRICRDGYPGKRWPCSIQPIPMLLIALATGYQDQNFMKSLRFWLKTCFEIDPVIWPNQYNLRRVEHFMKYLGVEGAVANLLSEDDPSVQELQPLKSTFGALQYPHIKRFVNDTTRGFGKDSTIAGVAKVWEQRWNILLARQGVNHEALASFCASSQGKLTVKENEMKLLEWAEDFKG